MRPELNNKINKQDEEISNLKNKFYLVKQQNLRNNLHVFGVNDYPRIITKDIVKDKVLKLMNMTVTLQGECSRVGKYNPNKTQQILKKICSFDDRNQYLKIKKD